MTDKRWLYGLIAATLLLRGAALLVPGELRDDPDSYRHLAKNIVSHGVLGHGEQPSAYRAPVYPLLLVPCVSLGPGGSVAIGVLHVGLGLATVLLVYGLARRCGAGGFALLAAALVAVDPILLAQSRVVMSETPAALLAVLGLVALLAAAERPTAGRMAVAGGCLALGGLCRPELLAWAALAAVLLPLRAVGRGRRLSLLAAFTAAGLVVLTPWVVRNWIHFGRPVVATTHGGYTLLLGNNPSFYDYLRTGPRGGVWNPQGFHDEWAKRCSAVAADGELAVDRAAYAEAARAIADEPGMFLHASADRIARLWQLAPRRTAADPSAGSTATRIAVGAFYLVEFLLAALGLLVVFRRRYGDGRLRYVLLWGCIMAASLTAVHTVYWTNMRMRATLMPAVALAAAVGTARLAAYTSSSVNPN